MSIHDLRTYPLDAQGVERFQRFSGDHHVARCGKAVDEILEGRFVGGVEDGAGSAACVDDSAGEFDRSKRAALGCTEVQPGNVREFQRGTVGRAADWACATLITVQSETIAIE
jgi:hypothetical protein